ncbi:MAG: UDP-N-acetylmuramoyl-L-alanine--D-glutamate ligase, partial [Candidatus Magasanikbacteria bacterium]|nr:UDP-N-acetylmuramoyl-L-alanine--D-glutamate ligase [Candidatus Magasanikbacteria bacterium]
MDYRNKKILLMGLGGFKKGSGISSAEFLASKGADLTITDLKDAKELSSNLQPLKKYKNIKYILGGHQETDFIETDWVVRNPDVPPSSSFLTIARTKDVPIDNDITL